MKIEKLSKQDIAKLTGHSEQIKEKLSTILTGEGVKIVIEADESADSIKQTCRRISKDLDITCKTKTLGNAIIITRIA